MFGLIYPFHVIINFQVGSEVLHLARLCGSGDVGGNFRMLKKLEKKTMFNY